MQIKIRSCILNLVIAAHCRKKQHNLPYNNQCDPLCSSSNEFDLIFDHTCLLWHTASTRETAKRPTILSSC